jgi:outer membrane immunogenic protein
MQGMRTLLAGFALIAGTGIADAPASADGLARSLKDQPPPFSWTGLYVGTHAGLVTGETTDGVGLGGPLNADYALSGALYGGQVGYQWQGGVVVLGVEAGWSGTSIHASSPCAGAAECHRDVDWLASVVGRVGIAVDRWLLYAMGGTTWASVDTAIGSGGVPLLSGSETHIGWIAGVGFEHAFTDRLSTRIEYAHIDLGTQSADLTPAGGGPAVAVDKVNVRMDTLRLGVNLKLTH